MRNNEEIQSMLLKFSDLPQTEKVLAIIDVLENDLDEDEIEEKYFNENDPWVEQSAYNAREWLNGDIEEEILY